MADNAEVVYLCGSCNKVVTKNDLETESHSCWQSATDAGGDEENQSITIHADDSPDGNDAFLKQSEDAEFISTALTKDDAKKVSVEYISDSAGAMEYLSDEDDAEREEQNMEYYTEDGQQFQYITGDDGTIFQCITAEDGTIQCIGGVDGKIEFVADESAVDEGENLMNALSDETGAKMTSNGIDRENDSELMEEDSPAQVSKADEIEYIHNAEDQIQLELSSNNQLKIPANPNDMVEYVAKPLGPYSGSQRGDWTSQDITLLLRVYLNQCKTGKFKYNTHHFWNEVIKQLSIYGEYPRNRVQEKLSKLKAIHKSMSKEGTQTLWPHHHLMESVLEAEREWDGKQSSPEKSEEVDGDREAASELEGESANVTGLQRWTTKETSNLVDVYRKHLPKFFTGMRKKVAWADVLNDLQYGLASRFTLFQIRAKIRNIQNTYRHIVSGSKRKRVGLTRWPLFDAVEEMVKMEAALCNLHNLPAVLSPGLENTTENYGESQGRTVIVKKSGNVRWNGEETRALLSSYKDNILQLHLGATTEADRQSIWDSIAEKVNTSRRMKTNGREAKLKIDSIRNDYEKGIQPGNVLLSEVAEVMNIEKNITGRTTPGRSATAMTQWLNTSSESAPKNGKIGLKTPNLSKSKSLNFKVQTGVAPYKVIYSDDTPTAKISHQIRGVKHPIQEPQHSAPTEISAATSMAPGGTVVSGNIQQSAKVPPPSKKSYCASAMSPTFINPVICQPLKNGSIKSKETTISSSARIADDSSENISIKRKQLKPSKPLPKWFISYSNDANRRHREKVDMHYKIIDTLENILKQ